MKLQAITRESLLLHLFFEKLHLFFEHEQEVALLF